MATAQVPRRAAPRRDSFSSRRLQQQQQMGAQQAIAKPWLAVLPHGSSFPAIASLRRRSPAILLPALLLLLLPVVLLLLWMGAGLRQDHTTDSPRFVSHVDWTSGKLRMHYEQHPWSSSSATTTRDSSQKEPGELGGLRIRDDSGSRGRSGSSSGGFVADGKSFVEVEGVRLNGERLLSGFELIGENRGLWRRSVRSFSTSSSHSTASASVSEVEVETETETETETEMEMEMLVEELSPRAVALTWRVLSPLPLPPPPPAQAAPGGGGGERGEAEAQPAFLQIRIRDPVRECAWYGGGERFNGVNQKGNCLPMFSVDRATKLLAHRSYKPIPFVMSSSGYGVWVDSYAAGNFSLGEEEGEPSVLVINYPLSSTLPSEDAEAYDRNGPAGTRFPPDVGAAATAAQEDQLQPHLQQGQEERQRHRQLQLRVVLIVGPELLDVVAEFTRLSHSRPAVPPDWSFAPWKGRDVHFNCSEVVADVESLRRHGIPGSVLLIDSPWARGYNDFVLNQVQFSEPDAMFRRLEELGYTDDMARVDVANVVIFTIPFHVFDVEE